MVEPRLRHLARLESLLPRLRLAHRQHVTSDDETRRLALELALNRLHLRLAFPNAGTSHLTSSVREQPSGPATDTRLAHAIRRLLANLPSSSDAWEQESRVLHLFRSYEHAAGNLAVSIERQLAELSARLSVARQALRAELSPPEYFNPFDVLRIKRRGIRCTATCSPGCSIPSATTGWAPAFSIRCFS